VTTSGVTNRAESGMGWVVRVRSMWSVMSHCFAFTTEETSRYESTVKFPECP
jgi:hypothetical protein